MKLGDKVGSLDGVNGRRTCERLNLACERVGTASTTGGAVLPRRTQ